MNAEKLSLKKIYLSMGLGVTVTAALLLMALYKLTESMKLLICSLAFMGAIFIWLVFFLYLIRKKLKVFSSEICCTLDSMMNGDGAPRKMDAEETLLAKINYRLTRLYEAMEEQSRRVSEEKADLQELISDISHQVKMPIANLKTVNTTLLEMDVPEDKRRYFLQAMDGQLNKLDFLIQAMIKLSRLETGVIMLSPKQCAIYETLAAALGGILLAAERRNISVSVDCPEGLRAFHDSKWTAEALFNILDNAVKYTAVGGSICITVTQWEIYTKVDISDTGKGILESRQAAVFKRFYREAEVHDIEGIGIGLCLAREIITMQGGYIKLVSEVGKGSVFSVFLPNKS